MELQLSENAVVLIHFLTEAPHKAWKKEHWHPASKENADRIAGEEISKIARWLNEKVWGAITLRSSPEAKELALEAIRKLKLAYEGEGPVKDPSLKAPDGAVMELPRDQYRDVAWATVQSLFERPYKPKKVLLGKRLVARLQDLVKHYRGKPIECNYTLTPHFSDLENALDGKLLPTSDDAEKDD